VANTLGEEGDVYHGDKDTPMEEYQIKKY